MTAPVPDPRGRLALGFLLEAGQAWERTVVTRLDGAGLDLGAGLSAALARIEDVGEAGGKLLFIGNGGSAAIASHQALDFWRNGGIPAQAFTDPSLLTCIANDFGYERVYAEPIARFAVPGDLLVAISSSGRSPNILAGVEAARKAGCEVVSLSGFDEGNPLRRAGDLNFWVPSQSYGVVELTHLALLGAMLEARLARRAGEARP